MGIKFLTAALSYALAILIASVGAQAQEAVRIALIDPFSGPQAGVGSRALMMFQFMADRINAAGGVHGGRQLQIVTFDDEGNAEKSLVHMRRAINDGIRYISTGLGAPVISEALTRNYRRDPSDPVLLLNYSNPDPTLSNERCAFWHFGFDTDADLRAQAMLTYIAQQTQVRKVYLINPDFSVGQAYARAAETGLTGRREDLSIVGNELIPLGRVKDFAPYVAKIKASGADALYTSNFGTDLTYLIKAVVESGLKVSFFTFYAGSPGVFSALGTAGAGVMQVSEWKPEGAPSINAMADEFEKKNNFPFYIWKIALATEMLAKAMNDAKSTKPLDVALALENMRYASAFGEVVMRKDNHRAVTPLFVSRATDKPVRAIDQTGWGWETVATIDSKDIMVRSTCKMERPTGR